MRTFGEKHKSQRNRYRDYIFSPQSVRAAKARHGSQGQLHRDAGTTGEDAQGKVNTGSDTEEQHTTSQTQPTDWTYTRDKEASLSDKDAYSRRGSEIST